MPMRRVPRCSFRAWTCAIAPSTPVGRSSSGWIPERGTLGVLPLSAPGAPIAEASIAGWRLIRADGVAIDASTERLYVLDPGSAADCRGRASVGSSARYGARLRRGSHLAARSRPPCSLPRGAGTASDRPDPLRAERSGGHALRGRSCGRAPGRRRHRRAGLERPGAMVFCAQCGPHRRPVGAQPLHRGCRDSGEFWSVRGHGIRGDSKCGRGRSDHGGAGRAPAAGRHGLPGAHDRYLELRSAEPRSRRHRLPGALGGC